MVPSVALNSLVDILVFGMVIKTYYLVSSCRPACDIAISGLGWVTIESGYREFVADMDSKMMDRIDKEVEVVIHTPKSVEVFVRPSLPVGSRGYQWYDFRELSEKEQEARPKVYLP